jgi:hypothetical protein
MQHLFIHSFIHSFRSPSYDRSIASSKASSPQIAIQCFFNLQYPLISSSCLHRISCVCVIPIPPSVFPSITCFKRQFPLRDVTNPMSFPPYFSHDWSNMLPQHTAKTCTYFWSTFSSVIVSAPYNADLHMSHFTAFFFTCKSNLLIKRVFLTLNYACTMPVLNLIPRIHLASFVNTLPKYFKYSTLSSCFWSILICNGDGCLQILITLVFPTFMSVPYHRTTSCSQSVMLCNDVFP